MWCLLGILVSHAQPSTVPPHVQAATAHRYLARGEVARAAQLYRQALAADPDLGRARTELLRALVLLRRQGKACIADATLSHQLAQLHALQNEPDRLRKIDNDPNLAELKNLVRTRVLLGDDLQDVATLGRIITQTSFYGKEDGPTQTKLTFHIDGRLMVERPEQSSGTTMMVPSQHQWRREGGHLVLEIDDKPWFVTLRESGNLTFDDGTVVFSNLPKECP